MDKLIEIIAAIIFASGVVFIINPAILKHIHRFFSQGKRCYLASLGRFALAIVFLLSARECDIPWAIITFAAIFILGGLLIFLLGTNRVRSILQWWLGQSFLMYRIAAAIVLICGGLIIYCA